MLPKSLVAAEAEPRGSTGPRAGLFGSQAELPEEEEVHDPQALEAGL